MSTTPHDRIRSMRKQVADIRATLAIVDGLIAPAVTAITNAVGDGYGPGNHNGPSSGISDPVGAAVARASDAFDVDDRLRRTWTLMVEAPNAVANLLRQARTLTPMEGTRPVLVTCASGIHQSGYTEWGKRDEYGAPIGCDEIGEANREGLCIKCWQRRYRWKTIQSKIAS